MKIAIVADVFGEENNGTTITIKRLISHLSSRGHEVKVVSPASTGESGYFTLPKRNFYIFNGYMKKNGVVLAKPDDEIFYKAFDGVDVVHIALPFKAGKRALEICREKKIPFTSASHCQAENVTAHVGLKKCAPANNIVYKYLFDTFYKDVRFVHCPSETMAKILRDHGYDMDIRVISNGVEETFKKISVSKPDEWKDKFVIMTVGRLSREKMQTTLINAIAKSAYSDKIQLVIAGKGPLYDHLASEGEKLPVKPYISFMKQDELIRNLNAADLYVHPSFAEIEAISCLEAISCGLVPIIADSEASATRQFALTEKNLFKSGDEEDLAKRIDYMIEHPDELETLKAQYSGYAKQFSIDSCIDKMEQLFRDAIDYYKNNPDAWNKK